MQAVSNFFSWKSVSKEKETIKSLLTSREEKEVIQNRIRLFLIENGSLGRFTSILNELYRVEVDDARKVQYLSRLDMAIQLTHDYRENHLPQKPSLWQRITYFVARFFGRSHLQEARRNLDQILTASTHEVVIDTKLVLHASGDGNLNLVRLLLNKGVNVNGKNEQFSTPLIEAAKRGNLEVVKELISRGAYAESVDQEGRTALLVAVQNGHADTVEYLAKLKPQLLQHYFGYSPLQTAVRNNDLIMVEKLLEYNVDVMACARGTSHKITALSIAITAPASETNDAIIELLAEKRDFKSDLDMNLIFEYLSLAVSAGKFSAIDYFTKLYSATSSDMEFARAIKDVIHLARNADVLAYLLEVIGGELPLEKEMPYLFQVLNLPSPNYEVIAALVNRGAIVFSTDDKCPLRKAISLEVRDVINLFWEEIKRSYESDPKRDEILNGIAALYVSNLPERHVARSVIDPEGKYPRTLPVIRAK